MLITLFFISENLNALAARIQGKSFGTAAAKFL